MPTRCALFLLVGACTSPVGVYLLPAQVLPVNGAYSRNAVDIWGARTGIVPSPDGKKRILVQPPRTSASADENHFVMVEAFERKYPTNIGQWVNAEVVWSPDSLAFFTTYSDGGSTGTFHVKVFYVTTWGLRIIEPIQDGRQLFAPICFDKERPNVAGIKWTQSDSSRVLIAVEVPAPFQLHRHGNFPGL